MNKLAFILTLLAATFFVSWLVGYSLALVFLG
jgi:hypothetical protein